MRRCEYQRPGRRAFSPVWLYFLCGAAVHAFQPIALQSRSGQFVIHGIPVSSRPTVASPLITNSFVRLDPAVLAVSCERIKEALWGELEISDAWRDRINIVLRPVRTHDESVEMVSTRYRDGWDYRFVMPDHMDRVKLLRTIVQALLIEGAHRGATHQSAEIPSWLTVGLAAHLQAGALAGLALEPQTATVAQGRRRDPLAAIRGILRTNRPLSIDQLSWPSAAQLSDEDGGLYRTCAQLLVRELLRLPDGPKRMHEMLARLPRHLNWQTSFLGAYEGRFRRMVDVEKWWALQTTHLTGVDTMSLWTPEQTLAQLDEALTIEVRVGTNDLAQLKRLTLQQALEELPAGQQQPLVQTKIQVLNVIRLRAAPGLVPLVAAYQAALQDYARAPRVSSPASARPLGALASRLSDLDIDREVLRRQLQTALSDSRPVN